MTVADNIRKARRILNLSMRQVGEELGTTQQTIHNIETKEDVSYTLQYLIYLRKKGVDINLIFECEK